MKTGDFEFNIDLFIFLVEARPVLWDKMDDIYSQDLCEKGMEKR